MKNKFNRSVLVIGAAKIISATIKFLRMAILARLLLPADFGIAATFWITVGILTAITEIGIDKIIIQDKNGDDEHFGSVAQTLLFFRGVLVSGLILIFHQEFAVFFDVPDAANEFALLAILPLLGGMQHRDFIRKQRNMDFIPFATFQISPEIVTLILVYPIAVYFSDYRAFVYMSIVASVVSLAMSHILADAPIRFAWDKEIIKKILRFGWPLTLSGILLVLTVEGDKLIISQYYSKHDLGLFAVAFAFATLIPNNLAGILTQVMLPYFSKIRDNKRILVDRVKTMNHMIVWLAISGTIIILAYSSEIIDIVYGKRFTEISPLVKIILIVFFVRLFRQVPNTLCVALGTTKPVLFSNIFRQIALAAALFLAINNAELYLIAASGILGEIVAMIAISFSVSKTIECGRFLWLQPVIIFISLTSVAYYLIDKLIIFDMGIILFLLVVIITTYSIFKVVNSLNELNENEKS